MTEQEVIERIDSSLAEEFELDRADMTPEANIYDDLGLDSLDTVDMVIVLEGAFDFKIREEEAIRPEVRAHRAAQEDQGRQEGRDHQGRPQEEAQGGPRVEESEPQRRRGPGPVRQLRAQLVGLAKRVQSVLVAPGPHEQLAQG